MKRIIISLLLFSIVLPAFALDIDADLFSETRVNFRDLEYLSNKEIAVIGFESQVDDNLFAAARIELRFYNSPVGLSSGGGVFLPAELSFAATIGPVEFALHEAYFTYYDFITPGLDLSVGKQRINWGAADSFNPTDVLNPLDLSDPFDFGKKIPSIALVINYTIPQTEIYFTFVAQPYSPLARLNPIITQGYEAGMLVPTVITGVDPAAGMVDTPKAGLASGILAGKFGFSVAGFDASLSYATRMADMPLVSDIQIASPSPVPGDTVTGYTLSYYREHMAGLDFAKDWGIFLTRAEVAVFFQDEQTVDTTVEGYGTTTATTLSSDPYVKYTLGMEKDFGGGFYMNFQYAHGFYGERGNDGPGRLQDYLVLRTQLDVLNDQLTFGLTGMLNVNTIGDLLTASDFGSYFESNYGVLAGFDIEFKPSLSVALKLGVMFFEGASTTSIGSMNNFDHLFLSCKAMF